MGPPRRAVRVLLDVERLPRGGLPCFSDAFVEVFVGFRRLALRVVEVARDDLRRVAVWISLALYAMVLFLLHLHAVDATLSRTCTPSTRRSEKDEG